MRNQMQNGNKPTKNLSYKELDRLDYDKRLDYGQWACVQDD